MDTAGVNEVLTIILKVLACTALLLFVTFMVFGATVIYYTDKEMKGRIKEGKRGEDPIEVIKGGYQNNG